MDGVQRKAVEQDLTHSSFMMLPLTIFILFLAYNYQKVHCMLFTQALLGEVCSHLFLCDASKYSLQIMHKVPLWCLSLPL